MRLGAIQSISRNFLFYSLVHNTRLISNDPTECMNLGMIIAMFGLRFRIGKLLLLASYGGWPRFWLLLPPPRL